MNGHGRDRQGGWLSRLLNYRGFGRLFTSREVKARDEERNAEIARISPVCQEAMPSRPSGGMGVKSGVVNLGLLRGFLPARLPPVGQATA